MSSFTLAHTQKCFTSNGQGTANKRLCYLKRSLSSTHWVSSDYINNNNQPQDDHLMGQKKIIEILKS